MSTASLALRTLTILEPAKNNIGFEPRFRREAGATHPTRRNVANFAVTRDHATVSWSAPRMVSSFIIMIKKLSYRLAAHLQTTRTVYEPYAFERRVVIVVYLRSMGMVYALPDSSQPAEAFYNSRKS